MVSPHILTSFVYWLVSESIFIHVDVVAQVSQVTQMGNALGFVRMVRSGGLRATASAIRLIQLSVMISYLVNRDGDDHMIMKQRISMN